MKDSYLYGLIGILLLFDIIILTAWQIIDPMYLRVRNLTVEVRYFDFFSYNDLL